jgi:hypothetical protein
MKYSNALKVLGLLSIIAIGASAFAEEMKYVGGGNRFDANRGSQPPTFSQGTGTTSLKLVESEKGLHIEADVEGGKYGQMLYVVDVVPQGQSFQLKMTSEDYLRVIGPRIQPVSILEKIKAPLATRKNLDVGTGSTDDDQIKLEINTLTPLLDILTGEDLEVAKREAPRLSIQIIASKTTNKVVLIKNKYKGDVLSGSSTHVLEKVKQ